MQKNLTNIKKKGFPRKPKPANKVLSNSTIDPVNLHLHLNLLNIIGSIFRNQIYHTSYTCALRICLIPSLSPSQIQNSCQMIWFAMILQKCAILPRQNVFGKKVILFVTQIEFSEKVIQYIFGTNGIFWKSSFNIFVKQKPFSEMVIIFLGQIAFCFQPFANLTGHVMLHSKWRALGNLF